MLELSPGATDLTGSGRPVRQVDVTAHPIPRSRVGPVAEPDALLLWVRHGSMDVRIPGRAIRVDPGQAVWLPPGTSHSVDLSEGSVAVPLVVDADETDDLPDQVLLVDVPADWSDWLLHRLSRWFGLASGTASEVARVGDLLGGAPELRSAPGLPAMPRMPRSREARAVVERLLRDPAEAPDLAHLAREAHSSRRTVQRQLLQETGTTFSRWRTTARMSAAASYLAEGRALGWIAHRVGYAGPSAFNNAFVGWAGQTPGQYAARSAARRSSRAEAMPPTPDRLPATARRGPVVPAGPEMSWVPPFESCLWVARGSVRVRVAGHERVLSCGDVLWLDRGIACHLDSDPGCVVLPLGLVEGRPPGHAGAPRVVPMATDAQTERFLMHLVVSNHFLLRPPGHDAQRSLDLLRPTRLTPAVLPPGPERMVSALLADPSDRRTLGAWSRLLGTDPLSLSREFSSCVGEPFVQWRATARMSRARDLLWDGGQPAVVARRLGYTHQSAFSRAFTSTHGIPPTEWLRRETR